MTESVARLKFPPRVKLLRVPLEAERVTLSPISTKDAAAFFDAVDESRQALAPWLPWVHLNNSLQDSERYAQASERDWDTGSAVRFFVKLRATRRLIGVVSLENCSSMHRVCQLGYWLHTSSWGQGLATEAARRVLDFAFLDMNANRVACAAGTENLRSLKVIERIGFQFEGVARQAEWVQGRSINHAVYALLRSDWNAQRARRPLG